MGFLEDRCSLMTLNKEVINRSKPFSCGDDELDDFFRNDAVLYNKQLLGKSYCFSLDEDPSIIVCAFTLSNDSLRVDLLPNHRGKRILKGIPHSKHMQRYPGVLIGRLGVNQDFARQGIGTEAMEFIKTWFVDENYKTGCRFLIVDASNKDTTLKYYRKNGFEFIFSEEGQEIKYARKGECSNLTTRLMYFDLYVNWVYQK